MSTRGIAAALAVLLASCGQKAGQGVENQAGNAGSREETANGSTALNGSTNQAANAAVNQAGAASTLGSLPPADATLRFVGLWATSRANCTAKPWRFTAHDLTVADRPHCTFYKVTPSPGGYDIAAQCPAKEPVHTDLIKLRFAESARAMLVESNAISPTGLIYCGKDA